MAYIDRADAIAAIRVALKNRSGRAWRVYGDRGTAYGWIHIDAPAARLTCQFESGLPCDGLSCGRSHKYGYLTQEDRETLQTLLGLFSPAHPQGVSITPDAREWYVARAQGEPVEAVAS